MPHTTRSASASDDEGTYIYAPYNPEDDSDYVPGEGDSAPEDYEIQLDEEDEEDEDDAPEELMNINPRALLQTLLNQSESDGEGNETGTNNSALFSLLRAYNQRTRQTRGARTYMEVEETDDEDPAGWSRRLGRYKDSKVADPRGLEVLNSGEFGPVSNAPYRSTWDWIQHRRLSVQHSRLNPIYRDCIPNTNGTVVALYSSKAYVGQFSADSSIYYTCTQDFDVHVYDATAPIIPPNARTARRSWHTSSLKSIRSFRSLGGSWTVTDSHLSADNSSLIYSTLSSTIHLIKLQDAVPAPTSVHLGSGRDMGSWFGSDPPIYSCRFSNDGREIVAGGSQGGLYVYDLGAMRRTLRIDAHDDDINSCCWADTASGNVLVSASDDTTLKIWDRRSFAASQKPSGVLIGHTEGITHVSPKGDGRYVISNGKDQILRLWDLRKMRTHHDWDGHNAYGHHAFDYRSAHYPTPRHKAHPLDTSVMTYKGHAVLRTLIRCHFSPAESTGSSYIYSGSYDGKVHVWSLDGRVVQVLDRSRSLPITFHPSEPEFEGMEGDRAHACVRDVAWQATEPVLMSCAWTSDVHSSVARHEWKGLGKQAMTLEDVVERDVVNEREQRRGGSSLFEF